MAVDAIGSTLANSEVPSAAQLSQEDFMRILLAQLQFQDPLKPMDNQEFVAQLAQFSALEINRQQSERVDQLLSMQSVTQSVGILGKKIDMKTSLGSSLAGTVKAVSLRTGEPLLTVDVSGSIITDVRLSDVVLIQNN
jgi:flagellar basal-body rod modification protein FlgD